MTRRTDHTTQFCFRLDDEARRELDGIAEYLLANSASDLVRTHMREFVNLYRGNKAYNAWKERKAAERVLAK